jgi:outer membrane receptor protein involved in Fe transport
VRAQSTSTITGRVTDPSGAAVIGAAIEAVNESTNFTHRTVSSTSGNFVLELLPVGSYALSARAPGFKAFHQRGITLQVNQRATLDIALELGQVSEQITVEGDVTRVDTVSGTLRQVVDSARIQGLPLNGRNVLQLQLLLPGVVAAGTAEHVGGLPGYAVNGGIAASNNYFLDGGEFIDPYFNAPQFFPNPDALQEFTIQTNASSAEYGRNRSGVIAAVTRSGTNSFHGGAFEFFRNTHLNARNFFAASVSPFHQNQFGAYLGGPVVRNKLFFFGSWESYRQSGSPGVSTITVLSERERRGDFGELPRALIDPATQQPFPGNVIPASQLNPVSQQFLQRFVPLPNAPNRTYTTPLKPGRNRDQFLGKGDWQISSTDRIASRWIQTDEDIICASALTGWCRQGPYPRKSYVANYTRTVSPTDLNNFVFTWNKTNFAMVPVIQFFWKDLGANIPSGPTGYVHSVSVSGRFSAANESIFIHDRDTFEITDSYSMVRGNHFLKIGGQFLRHRTTQDATFLGAGAPTWSGQFTGDGAADFVLGRASSFRQASPFQNALRQIGAAVFVQDDWKVTSRLTLNLGLRWDPWFGFTDLDKRLSAFRAGVQSQIYPTAIQGMVFPGDPGIPDSITGNDLNNLAPRFGFAWTPTGSARFAVRGGYGIYYDHIRSINLNRFPLVQPFVLDVTITDVNISDPFRGQSPFPYTAPVSEADRRTAQFFAPASFNSFNENFVAPYSHQWNLNIQAEPFKDYVVTAAYVGSKSTKLFMSRNINPALPAPGASVGNIQARRPYSQYAVLEEEATIGYSQYHSLQLSLNKRFSNGFTLLSSYTFAKDVGLVAAQSEGSQGPRHPFNYNLDKGRMGTDITHRLVNSFLWRLPALASAAPAVRQVFGGWEVTGILALQSGSPFTVRSGVDGSLFGINGDTADLIGDPFLDPGRPRGELIARYFNTAAFARNAPGTVGTSGIDIIDGPGLVTTDFGVNREFVITESHRLQFRSEFFNLLNRPNFGNPNATQNSVNFGRILSAGDPRVIQFGLKYQF